MDVKRRSLRSGQLRRVPPLSERKEDIPLLIAHFIQKFNLIKKRSIQGVTDEALSFLMHYSFPGNTRELQNVIEYAFIRCKGDLIGLEHLSEELFHGEPDSVDPASTSGIVLEEAEARRILVALRQNQWNRGDAARTLGIIVLDNRWSVD